LRGPDGEGTGTAKLSPALTLRESADVLFPGTEEIQKAVWSKISNALKRLGFRSRNFLAQLLSETSRACTIRVDDQVQGGSGMIWARMLAYITGTVDQELLLRNEYLAAENRILRAQIKGRLLLSDAEKATLAEIAQRLGRKALEELSAVAKPDTLLA
jgi:hypothetical protein